MCLGTRCRDDSDPTRAPVRDAKTLKLIQPTNMTLPRLADGFEAWLLAVRAEAVSYGKPVAYVHGDSHYFRVDRPLLDRNGAYGKAVPMRGQTCTAVCRGVPYASARVHVQKGGV